MGWLDIHRCCFANSHTQCQDYSEEVNKEILNAKEVCADNEYIGWSVCS